MTDTLPTAAEYEALAERLGLASDAVHLPIDPSLFREAAQALRAAAGGGEPVAWLHEIEEPDQGDSSLLSLSAKNPWSHWTPEHREQCTYTCTPLYAAPPAPSQDTSLLTPAGVTIRSAQGDAMGAMPATGLPPVGMAPNLLCSDCPPEGYPTDATRCAQCPRRAIPLTRGSI